MAKKIKRTHIRRMVLLPAVLMMLFPAAPAAANSAHPAPPARTAKHHPRQHLHLEHGRKVGT